MANDVVLNASNTTNLDHMKNKTRFQWFSLILYPDDRYHMILLDTLKEYYTGFYIKHDADILSNTPDGFINEDKENKEHFHVCVMKKDKQTVSAFYKRIPTAEYWRLTDDIITSIPCPEGISETRKILTPALVKGIESMSGYCEYLTHEDFNSRLIGKKLYNRNDIKMFKNTDSRLFDNFKNEELPYNNPIVTELMEIASSCDCLNDFTFAVVNSGDTRLLKYLETHSFFVDKFIIGSRYLRRRVSPELTTAKVKSLRETQELAISINSVTIGLL